MKETWTSCLGTSDTRKRLRDRRNSHKPATHATSCPWTIFYDEIQIVLFSHKARYCQAVSSLSFTVNITDTSKTLEGHGTRILLVTILSSPDIRSIVGTVIDHAFYTIKESQAEYPILSREIFATGE